MEFIIFTLYIYATGVLSMIVNNIYNPESSMQSKCKVMISLYNKLRLSSIKNA